MTTTGHAPVPRTAIRETQYPRLTLPQPPDDLEKYAYLQRNLPYLTTILAISATCLIISQFRFETQDPMLWPFMIFTGSYALYQVICLPVNFSGRGFDLAAHQARIQAWKPTAYPDVDIYLPICGEPIEMLGNSWTAVCGLLAAYPGAIQAYVLDDGPSDEARDLAASLGLRYIRRPGQRVHKKSGNLRYAFAHTSSEFIVIFDADFAPRPDFLAETLPYMDDPSPGDRPDPAVLPRRPRPVVARERRGLGAGGVLPVNPGRPRPVRCSGLRRHLGPLPAQGAGSAGRCGPDSLRRGRPYRAQRHAGRLVHHLPPDRPGHRDLPQQPRRVRTPAVPLVRRERRHRVLEPALEGQR